MFGFLRHKLRKGAVKSDTPDVPFSTFDGWLKCMRPNELNELQQIGVKASFARFYSNSAINSVQHAATDKVLGSTDDRYREAPYRFRRFAGGKDLPPGRYYAVAQGEFGWDGGTLAAELSSYIDPEHSGPVHVVDLANPIHAATAVVFRHQNPGFYSHALAVTFLRRDGWASPLFEALKAARGLHFGPFVAYSGRQEDVVTVYFPLRNERTRIDKVVDLRRPEVRAWMTQQVFAGIPTVRYLYGETYAGKDAIAFSTSELHLDLQAERAAALGEAASPFDAGATPRLFYGAQATTEQAHLSVPVPPSAREALLLRLLTTSTEGGSPITEAIGAWLRGLGAQALIYPSARMNARVHVENSEIAAFEGFNLVDYRGTSPPKTMLRIIQRPVTFLDFAHLQFPVAGPPPTEPSLAGSFEIRGLAERQEEVRTLLEDTARRNTASAAKAATPLFPESTYRPVFRLQNSEMVSIPDMRLHAAAGRIALLDLVTSVETDQQGEVGGWLLGLLRQRMQAEFDGTINWGGEWFCFVCDADATDTREFDLICPVCEAQQRWTPLDAPPPDACGACGFTQPPISADHDEARERFIRIHSRISGR